MITDRAASAGLDGGAKDKGVARPLDAGDDPRVYDCTWEWADDPCPDAKPGVDQKPAVDRAERLKPRRP